MTVGELIKRLSALDKSGIVRFISCDLELSSNVDVADIFEIKGAAPEQELNGCYILGN